MNDDPTDHPHEELEAPDELAGTIRHYFVDEAGDGTGSTTPSGIRSRRRNAQKKSREYRTARVTRREAEFCSQLLSTYTLLCKRATRFADPSAPVTPRPMRHARRNALQSSGLRRRRTDRT